MSEGLRLDTPRFVPLREKDRGDVARLLAALIRSAAVPRPCPPTSQSKVRPPPRGALADDLPIGDDTIGKPEPDKDPGEAA